VKRDDAIGERKRIYLGKKHPKAPSSRRRGIVLSSRGKGNNRVDG